MCNPVIAAVGLAVIGTAVQAAGQIQQQKASAKAAKYQQGVLANNALQAEYQAQDAIERGKELERQQRIKTEQFKGRQRAALAASGQEVGTGSALDLTADTALIGEQEALTIRNNAEREALGFRLRGQNYQTQSNLIGAQAASEKAALPFQVGGTLLGGAADAFSIGYKFRNRVPTASSSSITLNARRSI